MVVTLLVVDLKLYSLSLPGSIRALGSSSSHSLAAKVRFKSDDSWEKRLVEARGLVENHTAGGKRFVESQLLWEKTRKEN